MHLELVIVDGPQAGRRFTLGRNAVTFGRSIGAANSFPQDNFMSGMHLSVQYALSCIIVLDLRSSNGTFLNGQRIAQAMAVPGDLIKIGTLTLQVVIGKPPVPAVEPAEPPPVAEVSAPVIAATTVMAAVTEPMPAVTEPLIDTIPEPTVEAIEEPAIDELGNDELQIDELGIDELGTDEIEMDEPAVEAVVAPTVEPVEKVHQSALTFLGATKFPLFCLVDPGANEMIPSLLNQASERKESLYDGEPGNMMSKFAPYVVQLGPDSPLLQDLVENGWGQGWTSFFSSGASLEELGVHFRKFFMVQLQGGNEVYFRFYDPRVLRTFFPAGSAEELAAFFGPVAEWLIEAKNSAMMLKVTNDSNGLHTMTIPLAVTASRFRSRSAS